MTAADYVARVEALDKAATKGPWTIESIDEHGTEWGVYTEWSDERQLRTLVAGYGPKYPMTETDAGTVAFYRTAAPTMAAALRAVLALHRPDMFGNCTNCEVGPGWSTTHPCKTLEIIEKFLGDHDDQE